MKHPIISSTKSLFPQPQQPSLLRTLKAHKQSIIALDLHPSCKYIASAGMDNIIFLWNLSKKTSPFKLIGHKSQIHDLKFSPAGNIIVSASNDQSLKFWDIDYQYSTKQTTLVRAHNARIRALSFSCDGLLLSSCGDDKLIKIWSTIDRRLQYSLKKHNNWVRHCQFSPSATNLASCDDKFVYIWDLNTKKQIQSYNQHSGVIHKVIFHSLGNCMATCSHDMKIKLYDLRSQGVIQVYQGHTGPVKSIDFHPHSPYLISSSDDGTTKIWNSKKSQLQYTLQCHSNKTRFSRYGDYFITGGYDKTIHIWKTGFYDSLTENIIGGSQDCNSGGKKRVVTNPEYKKQGKMTEITQQTNKIKQCTQNTELTTLSAAVNIKRSNTLQGDNSLYYNHEQQHFQTGLSKQKIIQGQNPTTLIHTKSASELKVHKHYSEPQLCIKNSLSAILPPRLMNKLQRMSTQLDFITKTTQILQARITNNGEQLKRLLELNSAVQISGDQ